VKFLKKILLVKMPICNSADAALRRDDESAVGMMGAQLQGASAIVARGECDGGSINEECRWAWLQAGPYTMLLRLSYELAMNVPGIALHTHTGFLDQ